MAGQVKKTISTMIFGNAYPQEYLCLSRLPEDPLRVMITAKGFTPLDVTETHLMLGYKPLIVGIVAGAQHPEIKQLLAVGTPMSLQFQSAEMNPVAEIKLDALEQKVLGQSTLFLFRATKGVHHFMPVHQKITNNLRYLVRQFKAGNVSLPGNLYDQVRIAYSIPRKIRIVTTGKDDLYNMFPTDLHGPVGKDHYVISLRWEGKAGEQVQENGKAVLAGVDPGFFKIAYALGKNHMKELRPLKDFPSGNILSEKYGLPLPEMAVRYLELELTGTCTVGIHRMHFFRIVNYREVGQTQEELTHIHSFYANWRRRKGLETQILLR